MTLDAPTNLYAVKIYVKRAHSIAPVVEINEIDALERLYARITYSVDEIFSLSSP